MAAPQKPEPKRRRDRGDDGISWDKINKCYVGTISLGYNGDGKRMRPHRPRQDQGRGQGQARQAARGDQRRCPHAGHLHRRAVRQGLARSIERDPHTMATYRGQAEKWIYPKIGATKLKDFKADRRRRLLQGTRPSPQQANARDDQEHASPVDPPSAEVHDLIGRNVVELIDLPRASQAARHAP